MATPDQVSQPAPRYWPLAAGLAIAFAAARLGWVLIGLPEMPVYDEWSAVDGIALPLAAAHFDPHYLLVTHNEHLLVWTKLLDLIELHLAGNQLDARPAGLFTALLGAIVGALLLAGGVRQVARGRAALLVAGTALIVLPYAWENLTEGWGNPYLFLICGAAATLSIAARGRRATAVAAMIPAAFLSAFAMGSGWIAPGLGIGVVGWRAWRRELPIAAAIGFVAVQLAAIAVAIVALAGRTHAGAPTPAHPALTLLQLAATLAVFAPTLLFAMHVFEARRSLATDAADEGRDRFVAALAVWGFLHVVAMIALRPEFRLAMPFSRYMDILAVAMLANVVCALRLAAAAERGAAVRLVRSAVRIFAATTVLAAPLPVALYCWQVERWSQAQALVERTVREGDRTALMRAESAALPFPDRAYLQARLADPRVRDVLGDRVGSRAAPAPFVAASRRFESGLVGSAPVLLPLAAVAAAALLVVAFRRRRGEPTERVAAQ